MKEYLFVLPNAKLNTYNWFAFLLILLNGIFVFYSLGAVMNYGTLFFSRSSLVLSFFSCAFFLIFRNKVLGPFSRHFFLLALFSLTAFYLSADHLWLAALLLLLGILYYFSSRKMAIGIRKQNISYPGIVHQNIRWQELNNLILKDGMLTIDFRDDRVLQVEIMEAVNEEEFNDFCREQLKAVV